MLSSRVIVPFLLCALLALVAGSCTRLPTRAEAPPCTGRWVPKGPDRLRCESVPHNVLLFIGDGMGPAQVRAGALYEHRADGELAFESLPRQGTITTCSATDTVTDSAAAATAMATGLKVENGVLALDIPGNGAPIPTITEQLARAGKSIGLVTTTYITHATPAAFALHAASRYQKEALGIALLAGIQPRVLMGGAKYVTRAQAESAGYRIITSREELLAVDAGRTQKLWGMFGDDNMPYELDGVGALPHLSEMTRLALDVLSGDSDGFFLMVEGGRIDHAGHDNDIDRLGPEVAEFDRAVETALKWATTRSDTLVLVTADHETGGLQLPERYASEWPPPVTWLHKEHTSTPVGVWASGPNSELVRTGLDNTDLFRIMGGCPIPRLGAE